MPYFAKYANQKTCFITYFCLKSPHFPVFCQKKVSFYLLYICTLHIANQLQNGMFSYLCGAFLTFPIPIYI